ncbi:unnamed protein product [Cunninghamella blakesleeana]
MAFNNKPPPLSLLSDANNNNNNRRQQQTAVPPSPTFSTNSYLSTTSLLSSFSWIADKTPQDLIPMLKNAYAALKQKEEDLTLAAEIGKQLLNANVQLENNYNQLLNSVQRNNEGDLITNQHHSSESSEDDNDNDEYPEMRFIPSTNARQAMIEVLEMKNKELTEKLDGLLNEKDEMKNSNSQRTKDLEKEIMALRSDLDMAANKIHELEDMNKRQLNPSSSTTSNGSRLKKKKRLNGEHEDEDEEEDEMNELLNDMEKLQKDHHEVLNAKNVLENKLKMALSDLSQLKQQFEQFEFTEAGFKQLQETYDRQFQHITELNASLEEHRFTLQKLKDRGVQIHSVNSTPCPSDIFNRDEASPRKHSNLLSELEIEWIKKQKKNNQPSTSKANVYLQQDNQAQNTFHFPPTIASPSSSKSSSQSNGSVTSSQIHREFFEMDPFETLMTKASGVDSNYIDDALSLIYELEQGIDRSGYSPFDFHPSKEELDDVDDEYMFNPASISAVGNEHQHLLRQRNGPSSITSLPLIPSNQQNSMLIEYPGRDIYPNLDHASSASTIAKYDPSMNKHGLIRKWIMKAFHRIWRWFRFTIVLSTAIMISLWAGPDDLLLTMEE